MNRRNFLQTAGLAAALPSLSGRLSAAEERQTAIFPTGYDEEYRPQFHFSAARGFLSDPEMTVYYAGEYHLGYLACQTVVQRGPAHWGHAVSPDLIHWRELPVAVQPDPGHDTGVWSGGAVVDWKNTSSR